MGRVVERFANTLHGIILKRTRDAGEDLATIIDDGYSIAVESNDVQEAIRREQAPAPEPVKIFTETSPYLDDSSEEDVADDAEATVVTHPRFGGNSPPPPGSGGPPRA